MNNIKEIDLNKYILESNNISTDSSSSSDKDSLSLTNSFKKNKTAGCFSLKSHIKVPTRDWIVGTSPTSNNTISYSATIDKPSLPPLPPMSPHSPKHGRVDRRSNHHEHTNALLSSSSLGSNTGLANEIYPKSLAAEQFANAISHDYNSSAEFISRRPSMDFNVKASNSLPSSPSLKSTVRHRSHSRSNSLTNNLISSINLTSSIVSARKNSISNLTFSSSNLNSSGELNISSNGILSRKNSSSNLMFQNSSLSSAGNSPSFNGNSSLKPPIKRPVDAESKLLMDDLDDDDRFKKDMQVVLYFFNNF